jgi:hypothetical protein
MTTVTLTDWELQTVVLNLRVRAADLASGSPETAHRADSLRSLATRLQALKPELFK